MIFFDKINKKGRKMLEELIATRATVREYLEKDIPNEDLKKILKAGQLAPSWMNSQPWKFILIKNQETKELLSQMAMNQKHIKTANAVIAIVADKNVWEKENFKNNVLKNLGIPETSWEKVLSLPLLYPNSKEKFLIRSVEQTAIAMSFMILQARDLGVDSCVIGAIANETTQINPELKETVDKKLNLKENEVLISLLTLGYDKNEKTPLDKASKRKDFNSVVFFEKVGQNLDF